MVSWLRVVANPKGDRWEGDGPATTERKTRTGAPRPGTRTASECGWGGKDLRRIEEHGVDTVCTVVVIVRRYE